MIEGELTVIAPKRGALVSLLITKAATRDFIVIWVVDVLEVPFPLRRT